MTFFKLSSHRSFLIYQIARFATSVGINIIMARSFLPLSDLGRFESFVFYASALSYFWLTGISQGLLSIKPNENPNQLTKENIPFIAFVVAFLWSAAVAAIMAMCVLFSGNWILPGMLPADLFMLMAYMLIFPLGYLIEFILLLNQKNKALVVYALISTGITLILVALPSHAGLKVEYCIYGLFIVSVLKLAYLARILSEYSTISIQLSKFARFIKLCFPLVFSALIAGSATYIDGIIVSAFFDTEVFAVFKFGSREFPLFLIVASAFSTSMIPRFSKYGATPGTLDELRKNSTRFIKWLFPTAILLLLSSKFVFQYVFDPRFEESHNIFDVYLLLIISRFIFPNTILVGLGKNNILLLVSCFELLANIVLSLVFVHYIGYIGVAYGTVVAFLIEKTLIVFYLHKWLNIKVSSYIPLKFLAIYTVVFLAAFVAKIILTSAHFPIF
jgi:O-antigen/teichoic acid export membrane protein